MTKLKRNIRSPQGLPEVTGFCMLPHSHSTIAITNRLTGSQFRLWHYLMMIECVDETKSIAEIHEKIPTSLEVAQKIGVYVETVDRDLRKLKAVGLVPKWFAFKKADCTDIERKIRDRLQSELGGQVEVNTVVGRIDLLTTTEVIEIKNINNWKDGLGKVLAYGAFFPEHSKRIHLFGKVDLAKLAVVTDSCADFAIAVTFEEVQ